MTQDAEEVPLLVGLGWAGWSVGGSAGCAQEAVAVPNLLRYREGFRHRPAPAPRHSWDVTVP